MARLCLAIGSPFGVSRARERWAEGGYNDNDNDNFNDNLGPSGVCKVIKFIKFVKRLPQATMTLAITTTLTITLTLTGASLLHSLALVVSWSTDYTDYVDGYAYACLFPGTAD